MFNSIALMLSLALSILLITITPWGIISLFIILCFFIIMTYKGRCSLLIGKNDCELWDIYLMKEDSFLDDTNWDYRDFDHRKQTEN
jgi:hypothetical protein